MIPADVASRLRLATQEQPAPLQPVAPSGKLTDVLSDLVPGQRVMAEIQALLPNGTYRAVIAQREITLALPFSASTGDALELEVVESDGKLTLAFLANRTSAEQAKQGIDSVSTTLSKTGRLISELLDDNHGQSARPVPLNGNRPLFEKFSGDAGQLAPLLKEAITRSGMFYEAHQADWAEGKFPTEALLQEPQGRLSSAHQTPSLAASEHGKTPQNIKLEQQDLKAADLPGTMGASESTGKAQPRGELQGGIPSELAPLVRQQLDALASQQYIWQGQIWPGQQLHWEIEEREEGRQEATESSGRRWQTRLKLTLPNLGAIDAVIVLQAGGQLEVSIAADNEESQHKLAAARGGLHRQLDRAGLSLANMAVEHGERSY